MVLIGTTLLLFVLVVAAVGAAARRRWHRSLTAGLAVALLVALYAVALVGVSVTTPDRGLTSGEWKCFDDWCVWLTSAVWTGDTVQVALAVHNQGHREQAPDNPRAWLLHHGQRDEVLVPGLGARLASGFTRNLPPVRLNTPAAERPLLLVTEGGFPSVLVIGDDNSPFHPQPAWQLT